jgi:putative oxidoreductase
MTRPADEGTIREVAPGSIRLLLCGGVLTGGASLLHVAMIVGGPAWYRFFGAGEEMARSAGRGAHYPAVITAAIAALLAVWMLYALSGARVIRPLPFLRPVLAAIAVVYLSRGIMGVPLVMLVDDPYLNELRAKMTFMIVSSAICVVLGLCYAAGAFAARRRSPANRA